MSDRFLVVGDIHGCPQQLEEILAQARAFPRHRLVFLGDYIDKGPHPEAVLQRLRGLEGIFLLGNHEQLLIDRYQAATTPMAGRGWLDAAGVSLESFQWLAEAADHYETDEYLFVHGGLDIRKSRAAQSRHDYLNVRYEGDYLSLTHKLVVHGHHGVDQPVRVGNRVNLNTRCGYGGPLTALVLPEHRYLRSSPSPAPKESTAAFWATLDEEPVEEL